MPKMECLCGHIFDLSKIPSVDEYNIVPESAMEQVIELIEQTPCAGKDILTLLDKDSRRLLICPVCKRIHIEEKTKRSHYLIYKIEDIPKNNAGHENGGGV